MKYAAAILIVAVIATGVFAMRSLNQPRDLYLRAFKREGELEVWVRKAGRNSYQLWKTFPITARSGLPGPKRREGDLQVPEGFYEIVCFNPQSRFQLSMGLDYPNRADQLLADREHPGCDIYIHGGTVSAGCLPLGDAAVEEVYRLAAKVAARHRRIPVHIFPARMAGPAWEEFAAGFPPLRSFWDELQPVFTQFEQTHRVPMWTVGPDGKYVTGTVPVGFFRLLK